MLRSRLLIFALASLVAVMIVPTAASAAFGPLAGINTVGGGPTDTTYQLDYPNSVVRVPDGANYSFYVADSNNSRIVKLDADGKFLSAFGGSTGGAGSMSGPRSITYGGGHLYVATNGYYIRKYTLSGQLVTEWGGYSATLVDGKFNNIGGIAYDPAWGQIYAADVQNHRIQWFDDDGTFRGKMGTQGSSNGQFFFPRDLAFGAGGQRLFVLDGANSRVQYFNRQGANPSFTYDFEGSFGNSSLSLEDGIYNPTSITVDRSPLSGHGDRVYVTLGEPSDVIKVFEGDVSSAPPFEPTLAWGEPGSALGQFDSPSDVFIEGTTAYVAEGNNNRVTSFTGLPSAATPGEQWGKDPKLDGYLQNGWKSAVGPDGSIYALDVVKTRIQRFAADGELLAAWGSEGSGDGEFANGGANSIAVEPDGNVLVSDSTSGRVQRFGPNGAFIESITWPPISPATTISPGPIRTDAQGDIYVYDYSALKLLELNSSGSVLSSFGETGTSPTGNEIYQFNDMVVSPDGETIFVMDYVRLKKFTRSAGTWSGHPASQNHLGTGTGPLQFGNPYSIALDPITSDILIADSANNRIQRVEESADVYTWLETYGTLAGGFGASEFVRPYAVVVDQWGNMSVLDNGSDSIKRYGDAPTVTISAPVSGSTTDAAALPVSFTSTDPAADCDIASGDSVALAVGSNTIDVTCTNLQGSGTASVSVTRNAPIVPPVTPPGGAPAAPPIVWNPQLALPKKIKLASKMKFFATCRSGCTLDASIKIGKKTYKLKRVALAEKDAPQRVTLKVSKSTIKKISAALKAKKSVTLVVKPSLPAKYGATTGKTGKAKVAK